MFLFQRLLLLIVLLSASISAGCTVPHFDVPYNQSGQPTVKSIVQRIQCEIRDMVRDDSHDPVAAHRRFLLNQDMEVLVSMSIEVNDTGGLNPTLAYLNPLTSFTFSGSGTLSEARDHTFTENLQFSFREIYLDWYTWRLARLAGLNAEELGLIPHDCPPADTNLSGTLGINDFVAMAASSEGLTLGAEKVFGGSIQFLVTKNVSSVGPTWTLVHFKGPGGLLNMSQVNTDKITLAFAQGPNVGTKMVLPKAVPGTRKVAAGPRFFNPRAYQLLQQMLTGSINTQLTTLQNTILSGVR
ncbi:hypothetical protein CI41S_49100 [Bradyrhizobium ivorense]|nr:hypothetical protein CI41S_49100 [Bradyrhizobium ivorense]